ncbi:MAG: AI-2E family transporter [Halobacteriota archaeon]|uniref:AI-2E family transporter n=1 Tax=Natronomonas sp. TaxID=2184060 RepID=UPI003974BC65
MDGRRVLWTGLGLVVAVAIGLTLFRYIGSLLFAIFLYYAIRPVYRRLDRHLDHPDITVSVTILLVVVPMVIVVSYAVFIALQELDQLLAGGELETLRSSLDSYRSLAREGEIAQLKETIRSETDASAIREIFPGGVEQLSSTVGSIFGILAQLFLMILFRFYLLRDDDKLRRWFAASIDHDEEILSFLRTVDDDLETIFLSNLAIVGVAALIAAITYVGLNLIAPGRVVETPVLLALLIGIGTLISVVGMKIVYIPTGCTSSLWRSRRLVRSGSRSRFSSSRSSSSIPSLTSSRGQYSLREAVFTWGPSSLDTFSAR